MYQYTPAGICARSITINVENGMVTNVQFVGGCNGNLKGIGSLVRGMRVEDVIERLEGITCGPKSTSCPDQLAKALKAMQNQ
ncbi:MAG: TIGR03905 family TSCPD domain-containing protein [Butyricicoccaceae bacterium]